MHNGCSGDSYHEPMAGITGYIQVATIHCTPAAHLSFFWIRCSCLQFAPLAKFDALYGKVVLCPAFGGIASLCSGFSPFGTGLLHVSAAGASPAESRISLDDIADEWVFSNFQPLEGDERPTVLRRKYLPP